MKTIYILFILLCFSVSSSVYSQIGGSVFKNVKKAQDEAKGKSDEQASENEDLEHIEKGLKKLTKGISDFGDQPVIGGCLILLAEHAYALAETQDQIDNTDNCKMKKDLLGVQASLLLSSGTIIYCPEELLSDWEKYIREIYYYFDPLIQPILEYYVDIKDYNEALPDEDNYFSIDEYMDAMIEFIKRDDDLELSDDAIDMAKILIKFKYAEQKFGNPFTFGDIINVALVNDLKDINAIENEFELAKLSEAIDYFCYYASPDFMLKRSMEINFQVKQLPCD
ncbi:MAG: hypothetical protein ACSHXF_11770 [Aquaticitalea sp.]